MSNDRPLPLLFDLFESLPMGVVVLDEAGKIIVYNRAEERLAGRKRDQVMGQEFFVQVAPCLNVRDLGQRFKAEIGKQPLRAELDVSFPFPMQDRPRDVHVKLSSFATEGHSYGVLLLEDVSVERSVERMKETLQSLLIHDLKNPLAIVLANLGFVGNTPAVKADFDAGEAISDAVSAARRLQSMLLNLLDITRLETNTLPLKVKPFDLRTLLTELSEASRGTARAHGGTIRAEPGTAEQSYRGDVEMLRRALENLIDNALRHAKNVVLRGQAHEGGAWLEVADDGPGIPQALRETIFEKYSDVVVSDASKTSSNRGLGLTFVKLAARAHHGDVTVSCPAEGGTVFRLTLGTVTRG